MLCIKKRFKPPTAVLNSVSVKITAIQNAPSNVPARLAAPTPAATPLFRSSQNDLKFFGQMYGPLPHPDLPDQYASPNSPFEIETAQNLSIRQLNDLE